jgi:hypothetical protein
MARYKIAATLAVLATILALPVLAEDTELEAPAVDPDALAILRRATGRIASSERFHVKMRTLYDVVQDSGQKLQFGTWDEATIRRPNRAAATFRRDDGHLRRVFYDGSLFTLYDADENVYGQFPVPDTLDETLDFLELELGAPLTVGELFYSDLSHLGTAALEGEVVGVSRVGDHDCDHLAFRGETVDWQVWIERDQKPLIRKMVVTYKELPGSPQFGVFFLTWNFEADAPDDLFQFAVPDGAEQIPVLARPLEGRIQGVR